MVISISKKKIGARYYENESQFYCLKTITNEVIKIETQKMGAFLEK